MTSIPYKTAIILAASTLLTACQNPSPYGNPQAFQSYSPDYARCLEETPASIGDQFGTTPDCWVFSINPKAPVTIADSGGSDRNPGGNRRSSSSGGGGSGFGGGSSAAAGGGGSSAAAGGGGAAASGGGSSVAAGGGGAAASSGGSSVAVGGGAAAASE